jgi:hypothetical protein
MAYDCLDLAIANWSEINLYIYKNKIDSTNLHMLEYYYDTIVAVLDLGSKNEYALDKKHVFMIGKFGPVIKHTDEHNNITWKNVRKDISIEEIKTNKYSIEELLEQNGPTKLGTYKEIDVLLKQGKYGHYIEYNNSNINIKHLSIEPSKINLSHVIDLLDSNSNNQSSNSSSILRKINNDISIRNGKFGNYIYYKTTIMTKPQFIKLSKFNQDYLTCDINSIKEFIKKSQSYKK